MIRNNKKMILVSTAVATLLLTGCSIKPEAMTPNMIKEDAKNSMEFLNERALPVTKPISLDEAINRAVKHNLSKKVEVLNAALANQKIDIVAYEALPDLTTQAGYSGRDEYAASASTSFTNGQPDPLGANPSYSVSQDKTNTTAGVSFSWNVLDFGVSYVRANQQADRYLVAKEKERKAVHNISQEVRNAYYKAVSADELLKRIKPIMVEARKAFEDSKNIKDLKLDTPIKSLTYQRELLEVIRSLNTLEENLIKSKTELSRLMGLKPGTKFTLAEKIKTSYDLPQLEKSVIELETIALENRPELQETRYQERISQNEIKAAMLKMLPGINLNAGINYDGSDYLLNNEWMSYGAGVSWNLLNVFNGNLNQKLAKTQVELAKAQKMALSMAVITQVHMSVLDYKQAVKQYKVAQEYYGIADEIYKIIESESDLDVNGKLSLIKEKLNYLLSGLRLSSAYANVQNTYGKIIASTGKLDVFETPKEVAAEMKPQAKSEIKTETKKEEETTITLIQQTQKFETAEEKLDAVKEVQEEVVPENKIAPKADVEVELKEETVKEPVKEVIKTENQISVYKFAQNDSQIVKTVSKDEITVLNKVFTETGYWLETENGYVKAADYEVKTSTKESSKKVTKSSTSTKLEGTAKKDSNIRTSYTLNSQIVQVLPEGESVDVIRKIYSNNGTWFETPKGYISSELLDIKTK